VGCDTGKPNIALASQKWHWQAKSGIGKPKVALASQKWHWQAKSDISKRKKQPGWEAVQEIQQDAQNKQ
jgi:hypothetical protein